MSLHVRARVCVCVRVCVRVCVGKKEKWMGGATLLFFMILYYFHCKALCTFQILSALGISPATITNNDNPAHVEMAV